MPKVRAVGNALNETYDNLEAYLKANPDFVNTDTMKAPTMAELEKGPVMTTHTEAGEGHKLTLVKGGRRKTRRGKKVRRTRKSRR